MTFSITILLNVVYFIKDLLCGHFEPYISTSKKRKTNVLNITYKKVTFCIAVFMKRTTDVVHPYIEWVETNVHDTLCTHVYHILLYRYAHNQASTNYICISITCIPYVDFNMMLLLTKMIFIMTKFFNHLVLFQR